MMAVPRKVLQQPAYVIGFPAGTDGFFSYHYEIRGCLEKLTYGRKLNANGLHCLEEIILWSFNPLVF